MSTNSQGGYRIGTVKGHQPSDSDWPLDALTEALHTLHLLSWWKWWDQSTQTVREGTSPEFASAILAILHRSAGDKAEAPPTIGETNA